MPLTSGTKLGPYEIVGAIGAGGMGEVYRARDTRLGRDVAVKVLPASFSGDRERLRRFEQEARAAGALNHPNILAIHDLGSYGGAPFLVTELLEGQTLRERLRSGALPLRKALDVAMQAAHGVAAAHQKRIIHRDLKPANIFLTADGRVKILDFGLAKLTQENLSGLSETQSPTRTAEPITETAAGVALGTIGYMSPEQVRGQPADARSDVFALGTILYEMLSGQRAFVKDSSADTMAAILKEEPPELSGEGKKIPPAVERIVRHCLEKNPGERFQSAHDLAFDLESVSGISTTSAAALAAPNSRPRKWLKALVPVVALVTAAAAGFFAGRWSGHTGEPGPAKFLHINFRAEMVFNARFAPDGETIAFSAAQEGNQPQLFVHRPDYPAPQPIGSPGTELLSISPKGELAVLTGTRYISHAVFSGTLARMDLGGGAPRAILEGVQDADWNPDGTGLAIVRETNGQSRLEYPIGKVLYETAGYVSNLRFSPGGDQIAFLEHPFRYDDRGTVDVVDLQGHKRVLAGEYAGEEGLVWSKDGNAIYFSSWGEGESNYFIHAINLAGRARAMLSATQDIWVFDADGKGRLLANENTDQSRLVALAPDANAERDLTWLNYSDSPCLSSDGREVLFTDVDQTAGSANYDLLLRKTDGSPVVRLGDGTAEGLSPDGTLALSMVPGPPMQLVLYPTGAGEKRVLNRGNIENFASARFFPDGKRVVACGNEPGHRTRCYVQDIAQSAPQPVTPEGTTGGFVSPDGKELLAQDADGKFLIYPLAGGPAQAVPGLAAVDVVIRWSADARSVFVYGKSVVPARVEQIELSTGHRTLMRELAPADRTGVYRIMDVALSDSGKSYAYAYERTLSTLVVVEGVK
ncbi:MAG TPA: protein kinase [Candidatus Acidoferrales bacterium]|nr:protein kinase [Candidatus Acidoferrales bacterium]